MEAGAGMLCLCVKVGEAAKLEGMAQKAGRGSDVIRVRPGGPHTFNALGWASQDRPGSSADECGRLLETALELHSRSSGGQQGEGAYWFQTAGKTIRQNVTLQRLATGTVTVDACYGVMTDPDYRDALIGAAIERNGGKHRETILCCGFWSKEWVDLNKEDNRVGPIVSGMITNLLYAVMSPDIHPLVGAKVSTVTPADVLAGKIVLIDMPVLVYKDGARLVGCIYKLLTQWEVLRRPVTENMRPICVLMDEGQFFATPENDVTVQTVARESKLIVFVLVQSYPVLEAAFGGNKRSLVDAWMSNMACRFICSNSCPITNEAHAKIIGFERKLFYSGGPQADFQLLDEVMGSGNPARVSFSENWQHIIAPHEFASTLRTGGHANGLWVDAYFHMAGALFSNGNAFIKTIWRQG